MLKGGSAFYGSHPWHWYVFTNLLTLKGIRYFSQGFLAILGAFVPFFLYGAYTAKNAFFLWLILWTNVVMSFMAHKEFRSDNKFVEFVSSTLIHSRFVLPVLPLALMYAGVCLRNMRATTRRTWIAVLVALNLLPALYLSLVHQAAPVEVMSYIRVLSSLFFCTHVTGFFQTLRDGDSVQFLMPCHSTPFYSHVHRNISMHFWDCSPKYLFVDSFQTEHVLALKIQVIWTKQNGSK